MATLPDANHRRAVGGAAVLFLVFAAAIGIRVYHITDPLLEFHVTRQYRSAVIARALYLPYDSSMPAWAREIALVNADQGDLEPPIIEHLACMATASHAAGLTHGGFYAHFASREAMLAEAADRAGAESVETATRIAAAAPPAQALQAMAKAYLSKEHLKNIETGCGTAALCSEMPRQAPEVRRAATRRIKEMIDLVARQSREWGQPGAHEHALVTVATMVGALVLARAVDDPRRSDALRQAALKYLIPTAG